MNRKTVALLTALALLASLTSCFQIKRNVKADPGRLYGDKAEWLVVAAAQTKTGERLEFPKKSGAVVRGGMLLVPDPEAPVPYRIADGEIESSQWIPRGRFLFIETKDGAAYQVRERGTFKAEGVTGITIRRGLAYRPVPLADLDLVWIKRTNWPLTITVNTLGTFAVGVALFAAAGGFDWDWNWSQNSESCPFIYSYDGREYVLDAEPYGGAVCAGLERTDWVALDHLAPAGGRYKLLLTNELEEVENVDELKLVVVDHPEGVAVVPELSGQMRTIAAPRPPVSARDGDGRDILPFVRANDGSFWIGRMEGRDPGKDEDLKDELVLEFAKPAGARQAKLVANAWWTQWGAQAIKPILATQGGELGAFFDRINARGPALLSVMSWFAREEMYNLQVRVETAGGWKTKALIFGGGPMIAKDKAYALDLEDVEGDTVRVKLTPAAGFWMIDRLALDYSEDVPVAVTEVGAVSARDESGRDMTGPLAFDDGDYFVIPKGAGPTALEFDAPPPPPPPAPGSARTVFVKATGHYVFMLNGEGERTLDLDEVMRTPGETIRLALRAHPAIRRLAARTEGEGAPRLSSMAR
ncbi:MAG: hypothetical protein FJY80_12465 [Candidatus Aminicenantes bacterium]|nr:hypothetical protein [Candidatus Aminicenantes bacterium]